MPSENHGWEIAEAKLATLLRMHLNKTEYVYSPQRQNTAKRYRVIYTNGLRVAERVIASLMACSKCQSSSITLILFSESYARMITYSILAYTYARILLKFLRITPPRHLSGPPCGKVWPLSSKQRYEFGLQPKHSMLYTKYSTTSPNRIWWIAA